MFYTWGCLDALICSNTPYICMPLYICTPQQCTPPYVPLLLCICMFPEASACCGGVVRGLLHVGTSLTPPPVWGCLPMLHPTHSLASLCSSMFQGYLHVIWGIFSLCLRFEGVPSSVRGFGGISTWVVHMVFLVCSSCML